MPNYPDVSFGNSPAFGNASSSSKNWPNRYSPANDGSCNENVALMILEKYDIPVRGSTPARGTLCGMDINNMSAEEAIKLSLAENLADGKLVELYMDDDGFAYFQTVYPSPEVISLQVRTCVPTCNVDQKVDLVIVRGYDTPPVRDFKQFVSLDFDPVESLSLHLPDPEGVGDTRTAHYYHFATEAWKSYKDPILEGTYPGALYELNDFESLAGYVIDFDGEADPNIRYSFSDSTTVLINVDIGFSFSPSDTRTGTSMQDTIRVSSSKYLGDFSGDDRYGDPWPLLNSVSAVYLWGHSMIGNTFTSGPGGAKPILWCAPDAKMVSLPANNWHWSLDRSSGATLHYYCDLVNPAYYAGTPAWWDTLNSRGYTEGGGYIFPNVGGIAFIASKAVVAVEIDRPSVTVSSATGDAVQYVTELKVKYQPIVITDLPPYTAYCFGGAAKLVDHSLDLFDSDPSTVQDPPSLRVGSLAWLQTQTTGRTIDISLPFCDADDCLSFARTLYELNDEDVYSYSLVCGPDENPKLGTKVSGYDGVIERISYSFTDGSAYNINVSIGPTFRNPKSYQASIWQRATEDVSRQAIVVWSGGNGVDYRVKVQGGLGVYNAINMTLGAYNIGEKVQVTIHNNPKEK
jgi:hypothetical protein